MPTAGSLRGTRASSGKGTGHLRIIDRAKGADGRLFAPEFFENKQKFCPDLLEAAVNDSIAGDAMLSGCRIHRFLGLHKELDADDGELTRTRKVCRRIIEDKYSVVITELYNGSENISTVTEMTCEDGRKGAISAMLAIRCVIPSCRQDGRAMNAAGGITADGRDERRGDGRHDALYT